MLNDLSPILVTGGAGFIGSNFVLDWLALVGTPVVNLDKLTYAGNLQNLTSVEQHPGYHFEQGDMRQWNPGPGWFGSMNLGELRPSHRHGTAMKHEGHNSPFSYSGFLDGGVGGLLVGFWEPEPLGS